MLRLDQTSTTHTVHEGGGGVPQNSTGPLRIGESILAATEAELLDFQSDALQETQEDVSFALGGRLRDSRRGTASQETVRSRVLAHKLVAELGSVDPVELDSVLNGPQDWLHSPQLLQALKQRTGDPGEMALMLGAWLAHGKLERKTRRKLEAALAELTTSDDMALSLFGALEVGPLTVGMREQLVSVYHRASASRQKLSQWIEALGERERRKKKLRMMLRVLSYDLSISGAPIVGSHLAAVIGDLKQLLRLLGIEAHCDQAATTLSLPAVDGEKLLRSMIFLFEEMWVDANYVAGIIPNIERSQQYRLAQTVAKLVQLVPQECFVDEGHKEQLEDAIAEWRDSTLD